jgi:hypothetical protein
MNHRIVLDVIREEIDIDRLWAHQRAHDPRLRFGAALDNAWWELWTPVRDRLERLVVWWGGLP